MLNQILTALTHNPWFIALGTVAFFSIKGILWLVIPFLVIRWRGLAIHRRRDSQTSTSETASTHPAPAIAPQSKRAA